MTGCRSEDKTTLLGSGRVIPAASSIPKSLGKETLVANVLDVTDASWEQEVLNADLPVMVDFWAPWCGPCKMLSPVVDELARDLDGRLKVVKCNTDEARPVAGRYQIISIPQLLLFKNGKVVEQVMGFQPKQRILERIEKHL